MLTVRKAAEARTWQPGFSRHLSQDCRSEAAVVTALLVHALPSYPPAIGRPQTPRRAELRLKPRPRASGHRRSRGPVHTVWQCSSVLTISIGGSERPLVLACHVGPGTSRDRRRRGRRTEKQRDTGETDCRVGGEASRKSVSGESWASVSSCNAATSDVAQMPRTRRERTRTGAAM